MRLIDADAISANIHSWLDGADGDVVYIDRTELFDLIDNAPSIERKRGEWVEKETFHNGDDEPIIEEWQSALCSVCHKYHTTPYMYYFNNYNFCPNCGADMRGKGDD